MTQQDIKTMAQHAYQRQNVTHESPLGLIARIFQSALVDLGRARVAIEQGDPAAKGRAIGRALHAFSLLQGSLNVEQGGEVAANLDRLYNYFILRLTQANLERSAKMIGEIETLAGELGEAWTRAAVAERSGQPTAADETAPEWKRPQPSDEERTMLRQELENELSTLTRRLERACAELHAEEIDAVIADRERLLTRLRATGATAEDGELRSIVALHGAELEQHLRAMVESGGEELLRLARTRRLSSYGRRAGSSGDGSALDRTG